MDKFLRQPVFFMRLASNLKRACKSNAHIFSRSAADKLFIDRCGKATQNTVKESLMLDPLFPLDTTITVGLNTRKTVMLSSAFIVDTTVLDMATSKIHS